MICRRVDLLRLRIAIVLARKANQFADAASATRVSVPRLQVPRDAAQLVHFKVGPVRAKVNFMGR